MKKDISVSILNVENVREFLSKELLEFTKYKKDNSNFSYSIHFDIMDNKFVPNVGVDLENIKIAKELGFYADVHLMVEKPIDDEYINNAIKYGADSITIHYEIEDFENTLNKLNEIKQSINKDFRIGISIKPETNISLLEKYNDRFDLLLVMSVNPGFGGQKFIESTYNKVKHAKKMFSDKIIQIDGGVNFDVLANLSFNDVDSFVIGSYITKSNNVASCLAGINILYEFLLLPQDANVEFVKRILQIVKGGYGENDLYLGIRVPVIRKFANSIFKDISDDTLIPYINSSYHDLRAFAVICMSNISKKAYNKKDIDKLKEVVYFMNENIHNINNWDLTDVIAPDVLGKYLLCLDDDKKYKILEKYLKSEHLWIKRIGIVSLLTLARKNEYEFCIKNISDVMYDNRHLIQKSVGWVLRELYKKEPEKIVKFLSNNNKKEKLPPFVISYACELMSKEEKEFVRYGGNKNV